MYYNIMYLTIAFESDDKELHGIFITIPNLIIVDVLYRGELSKNKIPRCQPSNRSRFFLRWKYLQCMIFCLILLL